MSDEQTTYQRLAARFEPGEHKTKTIGGNGLTYVDGETVISRMNAVLGYDGWSFEVGQVNVLEREVWATGKLTVYSGERTIVREQAGGQIINRTRAGEIIELSNDIKGAITDCLKKCATLVGVGLYLYDPDERREVAAEMAAAKRTGGAPKPTPITDKARDSAVLTGAAPRPAISKERFDLEKAYRDGMTYADSIGLTPEDLDVATLDDAALREVVAALREQCRFVLAEKKKGATA
jgi:hypothetical protein